MDKTENEYEYQYMYQEAGIERLLDDIYKVMEEEHDGDTDAIVIRLDLETALQSHCMTPRERQCIALYYFTCLNMDETAHILGISIPAVHYRVKKAIPQIAAHMAGEDVRVSQALRIADPTGDSPLDKWLRDIQYNEYDWFKVPEGVWMQLRQLFPPSNVEYRPKDVNYNWRSTRSLREVLAKEIPRPEVFPHNDNYGSRAGENGVKQTLYKR